MFWYFPCQIIFTVNHSGFAVCAFSQLLLIAPFCFMHDFCIKDHAGFEKSFLAALPTVLVWLVDLVDISSTVFDSGYSLASVILAWDAMKSIN